MDKDFGLWMSENLELCLKVQAELLAAGQWLSEDTEEMPEWWTSDPVTLGTPMTPALYNAITLIRTLRERYPERFPDQGAKV